MASCAPIASAAIPDFYVAPDGKDGNPGTVTAPFATLAEARDAVRQEIAAGLKKDIRAQIRGGTYRQSETLTFGQADSGTSQFSITYAAAPGERVELSGGRPITGWKKGVGDIWTAEIPEAKTSGWNFRQLFVNGRRATRARTPNRDAQKPWWIIRSAIVTESETEPFAVAVDGPIRTYRHPDQIELVCIYNNEGGRKRLASVDVDAQELLIAPPHRWNSRVFGNDWHLSAPTSGKACYLENALEMLDQPGEWYWDRQTGVLSYWPRGDEDLTRAEVIAPVVQNTLLAVVGTKKRPVINVTFEGIHVSYVDWPLPAWGYSGLFSCNVATGTKEKPGHRFIEAAVEFENAHNCHFRNGSVAHAGGMGLCLRDGTSFNRVEGNEIHDLGGGGIGVGGGNVAGGHRIKGFFSPGWFGPIRAWCKTRADALQMAVALPPPGELPYPDHWVEATFAGEEVIRQAAGLPAYPDPFGYVSQNTAAGAFSAWGYSWDPGMVLLMPPGNRGKDASAVVRWTSPIAGKVIVQARFTGQRVQGDAGMRARVQVSHNAAAQFKGTIDGFLGRADLGFEDAMGSCPVQSWNGILTVAPGDVLDFTAGTVPGFNYGIFGIVNKQMLPGVGLEASIAVLPDEEAIAREWVNAKFAGRSTTPRIASPLGYDTATEQAPFSFQYGGWASDEWLKDWPLERASRPPDNDRIEHTLTWKDPRTGLVVRCVGVQYQRFPTVEWTLWFKNTGSADTPLLENIQALVLPIARGPGAEFVLRRIVDAAIVATELKPETTRRQVDPIPYFNLELPGQGLTVTLDTKPSAAVIAYQRLLKPGKRDR